MNTHFQTQKHCFFFNGQKYLYDFSPNLQAILHYFNYKPSLVVVELNGKVCSKQHWSKILINNNDKIETVTIVGGG